jgi:hypothetical protein
MKIYLAHPKDTESEAPELKALGLKFNKAEPSRIQLIGLYTLKQPGYESYIHHLPAFLYANDVKKRQRLGQIGYPIQFPPQACFPLSFPPIHLRVKAPSEPFIKSLSKFPFHEEQGSGKKEGIRTYTVTASPGVHKELNRFSYERSYAPSGQVDLPGYAALITAQRIFSSFLSTHLYAAYSAPTTVEDYTGRKRMMSEEPQTSNKSAKTSTKSNPSTTVIDEEELPDQEDEEPIPENVVLTFAKPQNNGVPPWVDSPNSLPQTYGMVFPFVPQLANWDKDMVPMVIEQHFIRCLGKTDRGIISNLDEFNRCWKTSVYSTQAGIIMSHLAKVIDVAIPSQARAIPIFERGVYRGCYLSGANFSVAIKGNITQPVSFQDNYDDLSEMMGISRFFAVLKKTLSKENMREFQESNSSSFREIHDWLVGNVTFSEEDKARLKRSAVDAGFRDTYLSPTVENVAQAIHAAFVDKKTPPDWPIHYEGFIEEDVVLVTFSAFGPLVPSPHIPGGKEISSFEKAPSQSTACFRRCTLFSAVQEWRDFIKTGIVRNEPRNLNARFQYVRIQGSKEKDLWYSMMKMAKDIGKASMAVARSGMESIGRTGYMNVGIEDEEDGGVFVGDF